MTTSRSTLLTLAAAVIVLLRGATAEAQLPKRGTYTGVYGWHFVGEIMEVEKDHLMWGGESTGAFRNDAGDGFLHGAVVVCTSSGEFKKGSATNGGYCAVADKDGDQAFIEFKCAGSPCTGEFQWTGGTGKYTGLKGRSWFQDVIAGRGVHGFVGWDPWRGEWELP
jgi:hypothetical protein